MPWKLPPIATQMRVQDAFGGTDQYRRLQDVWYAALERLPGPVPAYTKEQQYRDVLPGQLKGVEGIADPTSVHYLGLARDVGWRGWPLAYKRQVAAYLEQQGFAVERTSKGKLFRRHLHYGIPKAKVKEAGLLPFIQSVTRAIAAAQGRPVTIAER